MTALASLRALVQANQVVVLCKSFAVSARKEVRNHQRRLPSSSF